MHRGPRTLCRDGDVQSSAFDRRARLAGRRHRVPLASRSLEFVGSFEEKGWTLSGTIVLMAYTVYSLCPIAVGVVDRPANAVAAQEPADQCAE
jgi:hypothetical protein